MKYEMIDNAILNPLDSTYSLKAKTDRSARIEAKKLAKENDINDYSIRFYNLNDGTIGTIDN